MTLKESPTVLVVGGSGMLGSDVVAEGRRRGWRVHSPGRAELDLCDPGSVAQVAAGVWDADACVNCAAYTAVDRAEEEPDRAVELNALGPSYLARACAMRGIPLLHVGTDFVFDGTARTPYGEDDVPSPLGTYGRSKWAGEEAVLAGGPHWVVRTSWLFGPNGRCFPEAIVRAWLAGKPLRVVADQIGTPTSTMELGRALMEFLTLDPVPGIYHAAGPDVVSWHAFAVLCVETYARVVQGRIVEPEIAAIATSEWPTPAPRPAYSALGTNKFGALGIRPMARLGDALEAYWSALGELTIA